MLIKKIFRFALKIFAWVLVPLICVEILMIVLEPYLFKGLFQYDPDLGFRVRAYYPVEQGATTNRFGFNDRDYPLQTPPGIVRFLVVGDSFSWAGGLDGNYTALLERRLEAHYGSHEVDVINTGYSMTHPGEQLAMLKKYGLQYDPDLLLLGVFVGNDFIDAAPDRKRIVVNDTYIDISRSKEHTLLGYPIVPQSRTLLYLQQKYRVFTELQNSTQTQQGQKPDTEPRGTFSEETFLGIEMAKLAFFNVKAFKDGLFQPNIDYMLQSLAEMDTLLKARHGQFVVAIYPDEFQVNPDLLNTLVERFKLSREDYDLELAQKILKEFCDGNGIPYIDLTERFKAEGQTKDLYLLRDTHWNKAGIQLVADTLFENLVSRIDSARASQ